MGGAVQTKRRFFFRHILHLIEWSPINLGDKNQLTVSFNIDKKFFHISYKN